MLTTKVFGEFITHFNRHLIELQENVIYKVTIWSIDICKHTEKGVFVDT